MTEKQEAPASLEPKLVAAFREHHAWRRAQQRRVRLGTTAALAVAALLAAVSFLYLRPVSIRQTVTPRPERAAIVTTANVAPTPVAAIPHVRHHRHPAARVQPEEVRQQEVVTDFLPLDAASSPPANGEIVRVEIPRSTMASFGFPIDPRRASVPIRADVLLGEDGMAHAVRFVTTMSYQVQTER